MYIENYTSLGANYLYAAMIQPQPQPQTLIQHLCRCYNATAAVAVVLSLLRCHCYYAFVAMIPPVYIQGMYTGYVCRIDTQGSYPR